MSLFSRICGLSVREENQVISMAALNRGPSARVRSDT
jgi:hypothetical protein